MFSGDKNNFEKDFGYANKLSENMLPILNSKLKHGSCVQTEHLNEKVARLLDKKSGIDGIYLSGSGVGGLAIRTQQYKNKNWKTFTIRYSRSTGTETEYSKRLKSIISGNEFYPHYTCQAYYNDNLELIGGAFVFTVDLYGIAQKYEPFDKKLNVYVQDNYNDGNTFIVVPFNEFDKHKLPILKF